MPSQISRMIDRVVAARLAPSLKDRGFYKSRRNFYKPMTDLTHVLNIEGHPWNRGRSGSFTVNLGLFLPPVFEFYNGWRPAEPRIRHCEIRVHLSELIYGRDLWWPIGPETNLEIASEDLEAAVLGVGLSFFKRLRNLGEVLYALEEELIEVGEGAGRRLWTTALLHHHLGHEVQARRLLRKSLLETEGQPGHAYALQVCERLGITV